VSTALIAPTATSPMADAAPPLKVNLVFPFTFDGFTFSVSVASLKKVSGSTSVSVVVTVPFPV